MSLPFIAIGIGAMMGAWCRWGLGCALNHLFPALPLGTLMANLIGGFLIGIMVVLTKEHSLLPDSLRLGIITGFLGALTTFSTFSAEIIHLFSHGQLLFGILAVGAHVLGSLTLTTCAIFLTRWLLS